MICLRLQLVCNRNPSICEIDFCWQLVQDRSQRHKTNNLRMVKYLHFLSVCVSSCLYVCIFNSLTFSLSLHGWIFLSETLANTFSLFPSVYICLFLYVYVFLSLIFWPFTSSKCQLWFSCCYGKVLPAPLGHSPSTPLPPLPFYLPSIFQPCISPPIEAPMFQLTSGNDAWGQ